MQKTKALLLIENVKLKSLLKFITYISIFLIGIIVFTYVNIHAIIHAIINHTQYFPIESNNSISIWNSNSTLTVSGNLHNNYLTGQIPDTFISHFVIQSNQTVTLAILTTFGYVQFVNSGGNLSGIYPKYVDTGKDINFWFNQSTGCAGYMFVVVANVTVKIIPNETAIYKPSSVPTGICS